MKRVIILTFLFIFSFAKSQSEGNLQWEWAHSIDIDFGAGVVAVSKQGEIAVGTLGNIGRFNSSGAISGSHTLSLMQRVTAITFDNDQNLYVGLNSGEIIKYNQSGAIMWVKAIQGVEWRSLRVSDDQSVYLCGYKPSYNGMVNQYHITKLDALGNVVWDRTSQQDMHTFPLSIEIDKDENCYVGGAYHSFASMGSYSISGEASGFICCIDSLGTFKWLNKIGTSGGSFGDVGLDNEGFLYVTGNYSDTTHIAGIFLDGKLGPGSGLCSFLARFKDNGEGVWAVTTSEGIFAPRVEADSSGCYVSVNLNENAWGTMINFLFYGTGNKTLSLNRSKSESALIRYDKTGDPIIILASKSLTGHDSRSHGLGRDASGACYLLGELDGTYQFGDHQVQKYAYLAKISDPRKTNLRENENKIGGEIYPNPTNDKVRIELRDNGSYSIRLLSAEGKLLQEILDASNCVELSLDKYKSGIYFVQLKNGEILETRKLILIN